MIMLNSDDKSFHTYLVNQPFALMIAINFTKIDFYKFLRNSLSIYFLQSLSITFVSCAPIYYKPPKIIEILE